MKFVLISEPTQKCENNAIFKQNNALELLISLKMAISCYFCLRGNINFPDLLQIKFYNINYWKRSFGSLIVHIKFQKSSGNFKGWGLVFSHRQEIILNVYSQLYWKDANKEKEAGNGTYFTINTIANDWIWTNGGSVSSTNCATT